MGTGAAVAEVAALAAAIGVMSMASQKHHHGLVGVTAASHSVTCDICADPIAIGALYATCPKCNYDECHDCFQITRS